jgi:cytochrome c-type biogenesis protein
VEYFSQVGCTHCAAFETILGQVKSEGNYSLNVSSYEIRYNAGNRQLFLDTMAKFKIPESQWGTPAVIIGGSDIFLGAISKQEFEAKLDACLARNCSAGEVAANSQNPISPELINPFNVFLAGLVSGFNPCLFAVLLFLISYSLGMSENKMRLVKLTLSFSLGIFAAYFIIGMGLLSFAQFININLLVTAVAAVVILLGLWVIIDYRNPKSILVETPDSVKGMSESMVRKNSVFTAFLLGGLFSLVKAPCVGGLYLTILAMVSSSSGGINLHALPLLAAYNLGLVFPLLLISGAVLLGVPPDRIEKWRERNKHGMRIFIGATLILVGIIMLWQEKIITF